MKRTLIILGHVSFLITAILALVFYKERTLFVDSGQLIFEMLNDGKFKVFLNRYSMVRSEILPWLAIKAGLPLKQVLVIYSLSFVVVYYLCFLICIYGFKNIPAGVTIAFTPLIIRLAFGQSVCESWMGVAYSVVFYATINYYDEWKRRGNSFVLLFYTIAIFLICLNYFMHPITLFTMLFALGFTWINKKKFTSPHIYALSLIAVLPFLIKFILPSHAYEENMFEGLRHPIKILPIIFQTAIPSLLKHYFYSTYIYLAIPTVLSAILFIRKKRTLPFIFSVLFGCLYLFIIMLSFYKGDATFMLESRIIPLVLMVLIPFIEIIKDEKNHRVISGLLIILLVGSFINIVSSVQQTHTKRLKAYMYFFDIAQKYPGSKFFVHLPPNKQNPINSWGSSGETLMLSSLEGYEKSKTIIFLTDDMHIEEGINNYPCIFLWVPWRLYVAESYLSKKYFQLNCTKYQELKYPDSFQ